MKLLFYEDPTCIFDKFEPSVEHFFCFFKYYFLDNFEHEKNDKLEVKSIVPESTYYQNKCLHKIDDLNLIPIENEEIRNIFPDLDFLSISKKMLSDTLNNDQRNLLKELYLIKLDNYKPDIIFCFNHMNKIFNELFPKALVLSVESGIFSRAPFMRTIFYDPCGTSHFSFLNKYKKEIQKFEISKEQNDTINNFKQELVSIIEQHNSFSQQIQEYLSKFRYNILVPLQFLGIPNVEVETDFKSFFEYMSYIMDNIPKDIGVFVTQHMLYQSLNSGMLMYFREKYPNFIFLDDLHYKSDTVPSLYLFKYVDAIFNICSQAGFMGLLWDKKIISFGKSFNNLIKDSDDVYNIVKVLESPAKNKNNIIYWLFTHYYIFQKDIFQKNWIYDYLKIKLNKYRKQEINFSYYEQINDIEDICNYIMSSVKGFYSDK